MNRLIYIYIIILSSLFISCEKVVDIDLSESNPRIVIEGMITNQPGPYSVIISKTGSYFTSVNTDKISDAQVTISDNVGNSEILQSQGNGLYKTSVIQGVVGQSYTLNVVSGGKTYTANSTIRTKVTFKSVNLTELKYFNNDDNETLYLITCKIDDIPGEDNFYRLKILKNNDVSDISSKFRLFNDRNIIDDEIKLKLYIFAKPNDTFDLYLYSIDEMTFNYYNTLKEIVNSTSITTPYNPITNLSNNAVGYFAVAAIDEYNLVVP